MKRAIKQLLDKKITRKDFLKTLGGAIVGFTGAASLTPIMSSNTRGAKRRTGYGMGRYTLGAEKGQKRSGS